MQIDRVLAPNPGPYTGPGTNTYIVSDGGSALVVDPGPIIESHREAIVAALREHEPIGVIVTHNHPDHAPLANPIAADLSVPTYGFAPGPEFTPDVMMADGDNVRLASSSITAVHTPGHTWDHLCLLLGDVLFTGDHIMGGSTVIIEDAAAYFASLQRVASLDVNRLYPGHGDEIPDAARAVAEYIEHRKERERQIVAAVENGAVSVEEITEAVYTGIDPVLMPAAAAQVGVQLHKLIAERRLVRMSSDPTEFRVAPSDGTTP